MSFSGLPVVNVLGIDVACLERDEILEIVQEWCGTNGQAAAAGRANHTVMYVNAHCMNVASQDAGYHHLLNGADLVYPDGISVVWAGRLLDGRRLHKITGADWIDHFCAGAVSRALKVYILAGKPGIAGTARANLCQKWPGLQVVGTCDGFFVEKSEAEVLGELRRCGAQVVFIGMGVPRQEKWIAAHRAEIPAPVCWGVGALFDYVAGVEPRVPGWMNALALEWLWRLIIDPAGKWQRYVLGNPAFVYRILRQRLLRLN